MPFRPLVRTGLKVTPLCPGPMNFGPHTFEAKAIEMKPCTWILPLPRAAHWSKPGDKEVFRETSKAPCSGRGNTRRKVMTIHFSQFDDKPPALDDRERTPAEKARLEELEKLTGSQISQAIEAECDDPDCPNAKSTGPGAAAGKNAKDAAAGQGKGTQASDESLASGIFHTESNLRCVL